MPGFPRRNSSRVNVQHASKLLDGHVGAFPCPLGHLRRYVRRIHFNAGFGSTIMMQNQWNPTPSYQVSAGRVALRCNSGQAPKQRDSEEQYSGPEPTSRVVGPVQETDTDIIRRVKFAVFAPQINKIGWLCR